MVIIKRTDLQLKLGWQPMSGEIQKHRQFVKGVAASYVSVNLNHVQPQDLEMVIEMLRSELESVTNELEETRQSINAGKYSGGQ